jgi:light-regulated signal transduction histidine kinase (bacteriophytochrome)
MNPVMSSFSEDDIRRAAEVREWLVKEVTNKKEELDKLRDTLLIVDSLLKKTSFITASNLESSATNIKDKIVPEIQSVQEKENEMTTKTKSSSDLTSELASNDNSLHDNQGVEVKPLKRAKDNFLISNAEYTSTYVKIPLVNDINLNINTPPFRSFFINRILEGMKTKDKEKIQKGEISESDIIDFKVDSDQNGMIKSVTVSNYREKERLNEIFNTATWVFTRMLEKGI